MTYKTMSGTAALVLFFGLPSTSLGQTEKVRQPPPVSLEGTTGALNWQNYKLDQEGLKYIKNDEELSEMIASKTLVPIPEDGCLVSDKNLGTKWRYVLQRVADLVFDLSADACVEENFYLQFNSAVRHIPRQLELSFKEGNLNAAPVTGPRASPHLRGASIDLEFLDLPVWTREWLKRRLLDLEALKVIEATLEVNAQKVFHVTVFKEYEKYRDATD